MTRRGLSSPWRRAINRRGLARMAYKDLPRRGRHASWARTHGPCPLPGEGDALNMDALHWILAANYSPVVKKIYEEESSILMSLLRRRDAR